MEGRELRPVLEEKGWFLGEAVMVRASLGLLRCGGSSWR